MVIHHFICYGNCSCSTYVAGSRGKTVHLFQKFSSTRGKLVPKQTSVNKLENPNMQFCQKKSNKSIFSNFFKYTKYFSVPFFSIQLLIHIKKWVGRVCSLTAYSVPNLHTVPVHLSEKWMRQEKQKRQQKYSSDLQISPFYFSTRPINQFPFLVIWKPFLSAKDSFPLPVPSFHP